MMKRGVVLPALAFLLPLPLSAQVIDSDVVDRLIAIVGDSVVVQTQVQEEIQRMQLQGMPVAEPSDPEYEELFRRVLDEFVDRLLVLQAAAEDSLLSANDATIDEQVNDRITELTQQMGGQAALQEALRGEDLTLSEYREILRSEARTLRIQQLYYQTALRDAPPVAVTDAELRERFDEARSTLQRRPKTVTFLQVVVPPAASEAALDAARDTAESLLLRIENGEDFATLAREYSDDPGTAELGGDLGWFRRGRMVREFEDAAFALFDGEVSPVVQSDFGFHVIKVERMRAGERQARHILIVPEKTEGDIARARTVADDVLAQARGGASMSDLFDEYSDPDAPDSLTVAVEQISELPPEYGVLTTATAGDFVGPIAYDVGPNEPRFAIVRVEEVREAGEFTFDDLRPQLVQVIEQEKQRARILEGLRARTHVEIRM